MLLVRRLDFRGVTKYIECNMYPGNIGCPDFSPGFINLGFCSVIPYHITLIFGSDFNLVLW